jgi:hypothetical protein
MAWLVCIKRDDRQPYQFVNDLVEVVDESVGLPDHYYDTFNCLKVNGIREDVENVLNQIKPQIYNCGFDLVEQKWVFDTINETSDTKKVWRPGNSTVRKWYNVVNPFKFYINIGSLTPEEKDMLQQYDINHPSIISFINKISKDLSVDPSNNIEETDLRNTLPPGL